MDTKSKNADRLQQIANTIDMAYDITDLIHEKHASRPDSIYQAVEDVIDKLHEEMSKLSAWANHGVALERDSISKDEAATLINTIIAIDEMLNDEFYTAAAFTIMTSNTSYTRITTTIRSDFAHLFDIMDILEEFE